MKVNKRVYYLLCGIIALPVLLFAATALLIYTKSDAIKDKLLAELNKSTGAHISIDGKVELSFFKHFPNVALELKGVEAKGSVDTLQYPLLKADRIYLLANFWDVVHGDWNIQSTSVENGEFSMLRTKEGVVNYIFETEENDTAKTTAFSIDVEKAFLKNIRYRLLDEMAEVEIDVQVEDASVSGNFTAENLSLHAIADVFSHAVKIKGIDYADEKQVSFDGSLAVMTEKNSYALNVERFSVQKNEFAINGSIVIENDNPVFDLAVRGKNISVKDIPMLLPAEFSAQLDGIKGTGNLQLSAEIKGALDEKHNPAITITGSFSRASLQIPGMDGKFSDLSFTGTFTNGSKQRFSTSVITVRDLSAKIKQGTLDGNMVLTNLDKPHLKLDVDGMLDLSLFNKFLSDSKGLNEIGGMLEFKNVKYSGKIADLQAMRLLGLEGSVAMRGVEMQVDENKIVIPDAKLAAYDKTLTIEKLEINFPSSHVSLSGKIDQMPGLAAGKGNTPKAELVLRSESINVKEILALMNDNETKSGKNTEQPFNFFGNIKVQANHVVYNKFNAYDVSGRVALNGEVVELKNFSCNTVDGTLDFGSTIRIQGDKLITKTHAQGAAINVNEMFAQFENFAQATITDRHVSGKLSFTADVNADFINGELDEKKFSAVVDLTVKEGELINFKSLENLSKFIDIEELRHLRFSTLKNKISISNQTVFIPEMVIESNAINIALSGSQTFKGAIDYSVKLNIFDVLGKKIRKRKDLTEYEEAGKDNFNFYLALTGTTDNPIVKYDKRSIKDRMAQQKEEFKILESEQNTVEEAPKGVKEKTIFTNKRKKEGEQEEELEFIEWEEQP